MTARRTFVLTVMIVVAATLAAQQRRWFELYDEAIRHVQQSQWQLAETKLQEAKKAGPPPGRNVLRYGMLRDDFFPDFYLGIVFLNTNRPADAIRQFELARSQKVNVQDREFQAIADFETRAKTEVQRLAVNTPPTGPPVAPPPTAPKPVPTGPAPATGPDPAVAAKAEETRITGLIEQALQRRDLNAARATLGQLSTLNPNSPNVATFTARITTLDGEIRMAAGERQAMRLFFAGNYGNAITVLNGIESELGRELTPRGYFYRACGLAAQALRNPSVDTKVMAEARRQFQLSARSPQITAADRRWVSPKILQALGS